MYHPNVELRAKAAFLREGYTERDWREAKAEHEQEQREAEAEYERDRREAEALYARDEMNRKATLRAAVERRPYTLLIGRFWKTFNLQEKS